MTKTSVCGLLFLNHKNTTSISLSFQLRCVCAALSWRFRGFWHTAVLDSSKPALVCSQISKYWPIVSISRPPSRGAFSVSPTLQVAANATGVKRFTPRLILALFARSAVTSFTWHSRGHTINISVRNGRPNRQARRSLIKQQTGPQTRLKTQHNLTSIRPQKTSP